MDDTTQAGPSDYNQQSRKCPTGIPAGQSKGDSVLNGIPSFRGDQN